MEYCIFKRCLCYIDFEEDLETFLPCPVSVNRNLIGHCKNGSKHIVTLEIELDYLLKYSNLHIIENKF